MSLPKVRTEAAPAPAVELGGRYAWYVLVVLVLVYVFNFIDRQIISILAEEIKRDLGLADAEIGFLYGTAFAVFYAVFGIPLGRLADVWVRRTLISIGLAFWSAMTALSGTARSFLTLASFRIGVGVGEASASPAAFSMLSDYFPAEKRATAISVYSSGVYIGAGIGTFLGGWIVEGWRALYPEGGAPFELRGWHVAYFVVGLPGLLMALWVYSLREPQRGQSDGLVQSARHPHPFREAARELFAVLPPFTLLSLYRQNAGGRVLGWNLAAAAAIALVALGLIAWLGSPPQWIALGIGLYAVVSWMQGLALRDPPTFAMIFRSRALVYSVVGFSSIGFVGYGIGFWGAPFFIRVHGVSEGAVGTYLGLPSALGGWLGVTLGGLISDALKPRTPNARLWLGFATVVFSIPIGLALLMTSNLWLAYGLNFLFAVTSALWVGQAPTTVNDLVLPRMRAIASAFYILTVTFLGLALGPYTMGQVSDALAQGGLASGEALRYAMILGLLPFAVTLLFLALATRHVAREEASRFDRARAAGEAPA